MHRSTRRAISATLTAVVLLLATVSTTVAAEPASRPFSEALTGSGTGMQMSPTFPGGDTFGGRCSEPSQWITSMAGTGLVRHLGRVTWTSEHCFQLFAGTFGDAEVVITAANGDQLHATYDGAMTSETTFAETMTILGGTGRFAGASGVVSESGWFDPDSGYMEVDGTGWIAYDASSRSDS
jgi:hypothetical protein